MFNLPVTVVFAVLIGESSILTDSDIGDFAFVASESRVIQLFDCIAHVFVSQELDDASAVFVNVSEAYVACFAHVIFQILP